MIKLLRLTSIRVRLIAVAAVPLAAAVLVGGVALQGFTSQTRSVDQVAEDSRLSGIALEAKYQVADWNGWQTAYAFDALRGVPDAAEDSGESRAAFLASGVLLGAELTALDAAPGLTDGQRQLLRETQDDVAAFTLLDADIAAGYRAGTAAGSAAANALVMGAEIENFIKAADAVGKLSASLATQVDTVTAQAQHDAWAGRRNVVWALVLALLVVSAWVIVIVVSITRPLRQLHDRLVDITDGDGDLTSRLDEVGRDETAKIAGTFNRFVSQLADLIRSTSDQVSAIVATAGELSASSHSIADVAEQSATQAEVASAAAATVSGSVQAAASGSEQMGAAIREIAESANRAASVAGDAVALAVSTTDTISELGQASVRVGDVLKAIDGIAAQTNLLALNATIEAARAGESGKGFAVVAGEVKELAQETARATADIAQRVEAIQVGTAGAVQAIAAITAVIDQISQLQVTISAAVEEQTATSSEMSRSIGESAAGADEIAANITDMAEASRTTTLGIAYSQQGIGELVDMTTVLGHLVGRFRY